MAELFCLILLAQAPVPGEVDQTEAVRQFETEVRPILIEHCHQCHGEKTQWGNLRLDSQESLFKGGDHGPSVVAGSPEDSLLIRAVRQTDENLKMPEEGKLSDAQIASLVKWVELGAVYPGGAVAQANHRDPKHWAFQPPAMPAIPDVQDTTWPLTPIDRFILAKLESEQMTPALPADKRTLIRRVTFDLTGLPPTPQEVADFLSDDSQEAYSKLIDRLLDSPGYGVHWGRHWLDVARYADSNGLDENIAHGNAWKYRDYVVASMQQDKPINQFMMEQLAGDLLPYHSEAQQHAQLTATGFLSIGPKVLAEVDQPKMRMDIVDEQIETTGRVFMGMTFGCARCHDHKFDPVDTVDYYGLAGVFKSTKTMDTYIKVAKWHENVLPGAEATAVQTRYDEELTQKKQAIETFVAAADKAAKESLATDAAPPEKLDTLYPETTKTELAKLREQLTAFETAGPDLPSTMGVTEDEVADVPVHIRGDTQKLGAVVVRHTPPVMAGAIPPEFSSTSSGRLQLAQWLVDPHHPLTARVFVNRVWRWHFGKGLVRTIDNFGLLGEKPTHPELLDWLALRFMEEGWSLKSLHRLILHSRVYQQTSDADPSVLEQDYDNRLLGRFHLRRLNAEEVRDSLLAVSGQLDSSLGGPVLKVKNRGYLFDHTSIDLTEYTSVRRSLYLPVIRNNVYELFQLLDFPDPAVPTGDRATSTVAPQSLMMMNSDFVMQAADKLAERLTTTASSDAERLDLLGPLVFGRPLSAVEYAEYQQYLSQLVELLSRSQPAETTNGRLAWSALCHTLLASNEFIYVK